MPYYIEAELLSPTAVSLSRATGNLLDTLHYIPGSMLRGAIAQQYISSHTNPGKEFTPDARFRALFLDNPVRFPDLHPGASGIWPRSARQCKLEPDKHPKVDLLLASAAGIAVGPECQCGAKLEIPKGFRAHTRNGFESRVVCTRRVAHVEIDPHLQRARAGQFHSSRLLEAGQAFGGVIGEDGPGVEHLVALVGAGMGVFLGRGRSRGQGKAWVRLIEEPGARPDLVSRIRDLNVATGALYPELRNQIWLTVTLGSPAICLDRWLASRGWIEPGEDLHPGLKGYGLQSWFSGMATVSGWHAAAGLPKPDVEAIAAGSCFLYSRPAPADREAEYARVAELLTPLETAGIGERREEGFGEISVCEPIHHELAPRRIP